MCLICQICKKECNGFKSLGTHISRTHENVNGYYDKFLKKENEGKCKVCGNDTKFYLRGSRKPISFSGWDECDPLV